MRRIRDFFPGERCMSEDHKMSRAVRVGLLLLPVACLAGPLAAVHGSAGIVALARGHLLPLAIAILASLGIGAMLVTLQGEKLHGYWAMLIATGVLLPLPMILTTVVVYLAGAEASTALLWGAVSAVEVWLAAAFAFRPFAKAQYGIPSSYGELLPCLDPLEKALHILHGQQSPSDPHKALAWAEVSTHTKQIKCELKQQGLPWVLARGYVDAWERLHRADEAFIVVAPTETVLAGALYDDLRLQNSTVDNRHELLGKLREAVRAIDPAAEKYLKPSSTAVAPRTITPPVPGGPTPSLAGVVVQVTDSAGDTASVNVALAVETSTVDALAREVLRMVRQSINEYRDERWNGLIVARNRLLATVFLTGLIVAVLLTLAMVANVSRGALLAASVFYLVGVTIGLGDRLRRKSQAEGAIENYGLSVAHLITIPLFSGLGAVGGVVLMAMLPYASASFGPTPAPPSSPPPPTISTTSPLPAGTVALAYFETLQATGGTPPYKWNPGKGPGSPVPDGLLLSATGVLSGTPTNEGTGDFVVDVVDTAGVTAEKRVTLPIKPLPQPPPLLAISSNTPLPGGTVGTAYLERLQATGGTPPYTWTITEGALPDRVALGDTGILSGTPQEAARSAFLVQLTDKTGKTQKKDLTISIAPPSPATAAPTVATGARPSRVPPMEEVFDLGKHPLGLLVAAVFGLAPGLLFDRLRQQVDTYWADLKSSQAIRGAARRM